MELINQFLTIQDSWRNRFGEKECTGCIWMKIGESDGLIEYRNETRGIS
jgi:hypothetical protein